MKSGDFAFSITLDLPAASAEVYRTSFPIFPRPFFPLSFTESGGKGGAAAEGGAPSGGQEDPPSDCLPCQQGCAYCKDDAPCVAQEDGALRLAVLSFQCLCLLIVFVSMILIYHFRRNKVRGPPKITGGDSFCRRKLLWGGVLTGLVPLKHNQRFSALPLMNFCDWTGSRFPLICFMMCRFDSCSFMNNVLWFFTEYQSIWSSST